MNDLDLVLNERYSLPHGTATLIGREVTSLDRTMKSVLGTLIGNTNDRYLFRLDAGHTWCGVDETTNIYCAWLVDIQPISV